MKRAIVVFACLAVSLTVAAQAQAPVIIPQALSPYGTLVTLKIVEPEVAAAYFGDVPGTLVTLDVETGTLRVLSVQPVSFVCDQEGCRGGRWQGTPAFSPDGGQIAWAESGGDSGLVLAVHTPATNETVRYRGILKLGFQDGSDIALPSLEWGSGGILNRTTLNIGVADFHVLLDIIDPATGTVTTFDIYSYNGSDTPPPSILQWATLNGEHVLALGYSTGAWEVIDLKAQTVTPTSEAPRGTVRRVGETEPTGELQYVFGEIDGDPNPRVLLDPEVDRNLDTANVAVLLNLEQRHFVMVAARAMLTAYQPDYTGLDEGDEVTAAALILEGAAGDAAAPDVMWRFDNLPDGESRPLIVFSGGT